MLDNTFVLLFLGVCLLVYSWVTSLFIFSLLQCLVALLSPYWYEKLNPINFFNLVSSDAIVRVDFIKPATVYFIIIYALLTLNNLVLLDEIGEWMLLYSIPIIFIFFFVYSVIAFCGDVVVE